MPRTDTAVIPKRLKLPGGDTGEFFITEKMLIETDVDLRILEELVRERARELSTPMTMITETFGEGIRVMWRPTEKRDRD